MARLVCIFLLALAPWVAFAGAHAPGRSGGGGGGGGGEGSEGGAGRSHEAGEHGRGTARSDAADDVEGQSRLRRREAVRASLRAFIDSPAPGTRQLSDLERLELRRQLRQQQQELPR